MAHNILSTYPDFSETLKTQVNATAFQLGAVIIQKGKPITLYFKKDNLMITTNDIQ